MYPFPLKQFMEVQFSEGKDANPTQRLYFVGLRSFSADAYNEFICISTVFDTLPICPKYV